MILCRQRRNKSTAIAIFEALGSFEIESVAFRHRNTLKSIFPTLENTIRNADNRMNRCVRCVDVANGGGGCA